MKNKLKITIQAIVYVSCLYLVYSLILILDGLQPALFKNTVGSINYDNCLNLPTSQLESHANQYPRQVIIWPAHVSFVKMIELQVYDLCMRRYNIQTDVQIFKKFSNEKLKMSLGFNYQSNVIMHNDRKFAKLISVLIQYYPFSAGQMEENDFIFFKKKLAGLTTEKLLYICLAEKQFRNADENICFIFENIDELITNTLGRSYD